MGIQVKPEDFQPCFRCGVPVMLVAYWDEELGKVGELFVESNFVHDFDARDYKGRLVVHEMGLAMAYRHDLACTKMPPPPEVESRPFERKKH